MSGGIVLTLFMLLSLMQLLIFNPVETPSVTSKQWLQNYNLQKLQEQVNNCLPEETIFTKRVQRHFQKNVFVFAARSFKMTVCLEPLYLALNFIEQTGSRKYLFPFKFTNVLFQNGGGSEKSSPSLRGRLHKISSVVHNI